MYWKRINDIVFWEHTHPCTVFLTSTHLSTNFFTNLIAAKAKFFRYFESFLSKHISGILFYHFNLKTLLCTYIFPNYPTHWRTFSQNTTPIGVHIFFKCHREGKLYFRGAVIHNSLRILELFYLLCRPFFIDYWYYTTFLLECSNPFWDIFCKKTTEFNS